MRHPCLCLVATPFRPSGLVCGNLLKSCCLPYPQPTRISITPLVRRHSWRGFCSRTPRISVLDPSSRVFERKSVGVRPNSFDSDTQAVVGRTSVVHDHSLSKASIFRIFCALNPRNQGYGDLIVSHRIFHAKDNIYQLIDHGSILH